jgi:hypothetical protein
MSLLKLKAAVRARDNHCCTRCGMTADQHRARYHRTLDVHRTTPGGPYTVEGCITLCQRCHGPQPRRPRRTPDLAYDKQPVVFYLPQELFDLVEREADANDRTRTAELVRALKGYYGSRGLWPPPTEKGD